MYSRYIRGVIRRVPRTSNGDNDDNNFGQRGVIGLIQPPAASRQPPVASREPSAIVFRLPSFLVLVPIALLGESTLSGSTRTLHYVRRRQS